MNSGASLSTMQTAQANPYRFCRSACTPDRMYLHVQKDFPFALCYLQASHYVIPSMTTSSVMSLVGNILLWRLYNEVNTTLDEIELFPLLA